MGRRRVAGVILQDRNQIVGSKGDGVDGKSILIGNRGHRAVESLRQQSYGERLFNRSKARVSRRSDQYVLALQEL